MTTLQQMHICICNVQYIYFNKWTRNTELQPEYLCIMLSSHILHALCLHSPSSGPPHSSLNNMILYNPLVYFSLLILVQLLKLSKIGLCQKKHGTDLPATLGQLSLASNLHPRRYLSNDGPVWERRSKQTSFSHHFPITGKKHRWFKNCTDNPQQQVCPKVGSLQTFAPLSKWNCALQPRLIWRWETRGGNWNVKPSSEHADISPHWKSN